jgi:hypothetical protein
MLADIKLHDRVIGDKKDMYLGILQCLAGGLTGVQTAKLFNLTTGRISQIYKANKQLCDELTLIAELGLKAGRLRYAYRALLKKDGKSKRDPLDWLEFVRKEIEGDKPLIDASQHTHYTLVQQLHELAAKGNNGADRRTGSLAVID